MQKVNNMSAMDKKSALSNRREEKSFESGPDATTSDHQVKSRCINFRSGVMWTSQIASEWKNRNSK